MVPPLLTLAGHYIHLKFSDRTWWNAGTGAGATVIIIVMIYSHGSYVRNFYQKKLTIDIQIMLDGFFFLINYCQILLHPYSP